MLELLNRSNDQPLSIQKQLYHCVCMYILCIYYMYSEWFNTELNMPVSEFILSQTDRRPMYLQIMEHVKQKVMVGDWPPGHALPSIRELAASIRVSVITVKRAYLELEREGVIYTQQGRGSFISDNVDATARLQLAELEEHLNRAVLVARMIGMSDRELTDRLKDMLANPAPDKIKQER